MRPGFTLIELILVIALLSVIIALTTFFYSNFYLQNAVRNTAGQLTAEFRKAQTYSMMNKQGMGWGVTFTGGNIVLYAGSSYASRTAAFDEPYGVLSTVGIAGLSEIDFARVTGYPNATATIAITGGGITSTVMVLPQGIITQH